MTNAPNPYNIQEKVESEPLKKEETSKFEKKYKIIRENLPENFFKLLEAGW